MCVCCVLCRVCRQTGEGKLALLLRWKVRDISCHSIGKMVCVCVCVDRHRGRSIAAAHSAGSRRRPRDGCTEPKLSVFCRQCLLFLKCEKNSGVRFVFSGFFNSSNFSGNGPSYIFTNMIVNICSKWAFFSESRYKQIKAAPDAARNWPTFLKLTLLNTQFWKSAVYDVTMGTAISESILF